MAPTPADRPVRGTEASIRQLEGKQLLGVARHRAVVTDRKLEDGGTDVGFTSGELLLLAIGSCAVGSVRSFFERANVRCEGIGAQVFFEPVETGGPDRIVIELSLAPSLLEAAAGELSEAALSGGVTGRIRAGTRIEVRFRPPSATAPFVEPSEEKK